MKRFLNSLFRRHPSQHAAEQPIIIVSGLPRSGTSLMMAMLEAGGISILTDHVRTADVDNPRGYYEFERVKKLDKGDTGWMASAPGHAVKVISALLSYLPDDYTYRVIFMRREFTEILASQKKMLTHRDETQGELSDAEMVEIFATHVERILQWLHAQPNITVLEVDYNQLLADPARHTPQIAQFLAPDRTEPLHVAAMQEVVDGSLYRNRS